MPILGSTNDPVRDHRLNRFAVCVLFVILGVTQGSWAARIPDVRAQMSSVSDARWGLLNVSSTAGSTISLAVTFFLVARVGPRRFSVIGAVLLLVNAPLLASSSSAIRLATGLLAQGFAGNLLATSMNAQAVVVERAYNRRIMSSFHAAFSLGQLAGGIAGALAAHAGLSPLRQLAVGSAVLAVALLAAQHWLPNETSTARSVTRRPMRQRVTRQLMLLGLIALMSSINEGAASQWGALYVSRTLSAGATAGAATFTCFSLAMAVSRLAGDRIVQRLGQRSFLLLSSLFSAAGIGIAVGVGSPAAAYVGFALLGIGSGCVVPTTYGLAGNQRGLTAAEGISVVAIGQWPAFLLGPPIIGAIAAAVGLRTALLLILVTSLVISIGSRGVRNTTTARPVEADGEMVARGVSSR
ncbi:MAG: major facilitator superfamily 1 [Pseudonocardiales bacterium]|nr:major facilitator superfamily 1 [Pseudonocardiales bacterium]